MKHQKKKWKEFGRKAVSILLCASMVVPLAQDLMPNAMAAAADNDTVYFESSRLPADKLPEGNCVYFGTAAAATKEKGEYAVRIYREGNLDETASVEIRTLDMTAVYGEDYELLMDDVEETGDGKTLLERYVKGSFSEGENKNFPFSDTLSDNFLTQFSESKSVKASKVSTLAAKKEAQTGKETRELTNTVKKSFIETMSDELVDDTIKDIDSSSTCRVTFEKGELVKTIKFRILEDDKSEGTEGFSLLIADATGAEPFEVTTCAISIEDDEKVEHSKISFTKSSYQSKDGKAVLTVKRTGAEYSICDMTLRTSENTAHAGINYEEKNDTLSFAPYETEKNIEIDVTGKGSFSVLLMDLKACTEGEIMTATVNISEEKETKNGTKTNKTKLKKEEKSDSKFFNIKINGKSYEVDYTMGDASGKIMDTENYNPPLEVGTYYFSLDTAHDGIFTYDHKEGSKPWGCGQWYSQYIYDNPNEMTELNYGKLNYYHTTTTKKGRTYAQSENVIPGVYYQYFVSDWESTHGAFGGQRVRLIMFDSELKKAGEASKDGQFNRSQDNAPVKNLKDSKSSYNGNLIAIAESCDEYSSKTPQNYVRFYGLCAMYRKFTVSLQPANTLKYRTGTKNSYTNSEPVQVSLKCGAQVLYDTGSRDIYANQDAKQSNLVFSVGDTYVNGKTGKFGKITGYEITLDAGNNDQKVTKSYPKDFVSWLNSKKGNKSSNNGASFETNDVDNEIAKVNNYLDTIPYDAYFLQWISEIQKTTSSEGYGFKQILKFKPNIDYNDVKVEVLAPKGPGTGRFSDTELKAGGEYTFHAGDSLNLSGEADNDSYVYIGYEVSTDGKIFNTIKDGSDLLLESFNKYWIRPVIMKSDNKIEVRFKDNDAASRFELSGLIEQSALEDYDKGKYILNLNPEEYKTADKMKPVPNKNYTLSITLKDGKGDDGTYVYRPTVKFKTANTTYTTQYFPFTAAADVEDNIIEIGVSKVLKSSLKQYNVKGLLVSAYPSIRSDGLELKTLPVSNYTMAIGNGGQIKDNNNNTLVDTVCTSPKENGEYEMTGISGFEGDIIPMLLTDGSSFGQIANVKLTNTNPATEGTYEVNNGSTEISYPHNAPKVTSISYSYDNDINNAKSDNTQNSICIYDDTLTISAKINPYNDVIDKAVFTVYNSATGQTDEYTVKESPDNENTFECKIPKMVENLHNGDRIKVRLISKNQYNVDVGQNGHYDENGNFVKDDVKDDEGNTITGGTFQIQYPDVDTGLVFYVENELIAPQSFDMQYSTAANVPLIGNATGTAQSGLLTFGKTWWDQNRTGYTIQVGLDGSFGTTPSLSGAQKAQSYEKFHNTVQQAKSEKYDTTSEDIIRGLYDEATNSGNLSKDDLKSQKKAMNNALSAIKKDQSSKAKKSMAGLNKQAWNIEVAFVLGFDFVYNPIDNQYTFACGSVAVGGTFTFNKTSYELIYGVPAFLNFALTLQGNLKIAYTTENGKNALKAGDFDSYNGNLAERLTAPDTSFSLMFSGKIQAGAGMCGVISARGYATLQLQFDIGLTKTTPNGALVGSTGGIGIDLLLFSIDINVYSAMKGWGTLEGRTKCDFFGGLLSVNTKKSKKKLSAADFVSGKEDDIVLKEYGDSEKLTMHNYNSGTSDMSNFGMSDGRKRATLQMVSVNTLLDEAAEHTRPKIVSLDDDGNKKMVVFIGSRGNDEINSAALYYSVYDGSTWSTPVVVAEDNTVDSTPTILKAGGKVIIAWADASREFTETDIPKTKLSSMGISLAVYDIASETMGHEVNLVEDEYFNCTPQINIDDTNIYISYMKRDISRVEKEDDLLNFEGLFSTMACRTYDYKTDTLTKEEAYINIYHDEISDPLVMDYTSAIDEIDGQTYSVSTYTVDRDMNFETNQDRELYLAIYNIDKNIEYFPIKVTKDTTSSSPELTDINGTLYLTWLKEGYIFNIMDVSEMLEAMFDKSKTEMMYPENEEPVEITVNKDVYLDSHMTRVDDNVSWYKKNASELGIDDEAYKGSIYEDLANENFRVDSANIAQHEETMTSLSNYKITTNGDDIYIFFTDFGKDENSTGVEIYGARYKRGIKEAENSNDNDEQPVSSDSDWGFGKAVQITSNNKVIDELDLFMTKNNDVSAVSNYFDQWIDEEGAIQYGKNQLVEIEFKTADSLEIKDDVINIPTNLAAGEKSNISFEVINNGLLTSKGFDYTVTQVTNGTETEISTGHMDTALDSCESIEVFVPWTIPENLEGTSIKVTVNETGTEIPKNAVCICEVPYSSKLQFTNTQVLWNNNEPYVETTVTNIGNAPSKTCQAILSSLDENGSKLKNYKEIQIPELASGEQTTLQIAFTPDIDDFNTLGIINLELDASSVNDSTAQVYTKLVASVPICAQIGDGSDLKLTSGKTVALETKAAPWNEIAGEICYYSSNQEIASVDDKGIVTGHKNGTAVIYAYYLNTGLKASVNVTVSGADSLSSYEIGGSVPSETSTPEPSAAPQSSATPQPPATPQPSAAPQSSAAPQQTDTPVIASPTPDATTETTAGTKKISAKKTSLVIAPGKSASVGYTAKADTPMAAKAADVTVSVTGNKKVTAKLNGSKVQITAGKKAVRGSMASVVLQSKNANGKTIKTVIDVKIQNKTKKLSAKKNFLTIKKGSKKKLVLVIKAQNNNKTTTDTVKISSGIVSLTKSSVKKKKITLTIKGKKKGSKNVTIYVGSKKIKLKVKVK